jgi:transcriptional regulator with XRE-family HTH domain
MSGFIAMIEQKLILKKEIPVLDQILDVHNLSYNQFSEKLSISPNTLLQYRKGKREFKLNMKQIKVLSDLLDVFGVALDDLPEDWILEAPEQLSREVS